VEDTENVQEISGISWVKKDRGGNNNPKGKQLRNGFPKPGQHDLWPRNFRKSRKG
jgi:hypothetical protein